MISQEKDFGEEKEKGQNSQRYLCNPNLLLFNSIKIKYPNTQSDTYRSLYFLKRCSGIQDLLSICSILHRR